MSDDMKALARSGVAEAQVNTAVTVEKSTTTEFKELLEKVLPQLAHASLMKVPPEYYVSEALTAVRANPGLLKCDKQSILHGVFIAVQAGLSLNPVNGEAFLVPRKGRANFQPGYRGLLKRARRSGSIRDITAQAVFENDVFSIEYGNAPRLLHQVNPKFSMAQRGACIGYYACANLKDGGFQFEYWDLGRMLEHAKEYDSTGGRDDAPWQTDFDKMALKTMLIQLSRLLPGEDPMLLQMVRLDELNQRGEDQKLDIVNGMVAPTADFKSEEKAPVDVKKPEPPKSLQSERVEKLTSMLESHIRKFNESTGQARKAARNAALALIEIAKKENLITPELVKDILSRLPEVVEQGAAVKQFSDADKAFIDGVSKAAQLAKAKGPLMTMRKRVEAEKSVSQEAVNRSVEILNKRIDEIVRESVVKKSEVKSEGA